MNDDKYIPNIIYMKTASYYELKNNTQKPIKFTISDDEINKYVIDIKIKDSRKIYRIFKGKLYKYVPGSGSMREVPHDDELEKNKNYLENVVVKKVGKEVGSFDNIFNFVKAIK